MLEGVTELTIEEQKRNLIRRINSLKKRYGSNNWEVCLYEGILECDDFFDKCYQQRLIKLMSKNNEENYPDLDSKL